MHHPEFDAFTNEITNLFSQSAEDVKSWHLYGYEYIDNLHFLKKPSDLIKDPRICAELCEVVSERFREAGWEGTGKLSLLWLPPFVHPLFEESYNGIIIWHVKQHEDGISWLLSPIELPFPEFNY